MHDHITIFFTQNCLELIKMFDKKKRYTIFHYKNFNINVDPMIIKIQDPLSEPYIVSMYRSSERHVTLCYRNKLDKV